MKVSATHNRAMSTFLLEMALDEARLRQRLGERLLAEREQHGGGNARRFPQPRMAELLGVTLRTYQDWEGGNRVPSWRNLEEIAAKLNVPVSELVGDAETAAEEQPEATPSPDLVLQRLDQLEQSVESLRQVVVEALDAAAERRVAR